MPTPENPASQVPTADDFARLTARVAAVEKALGLRSKAERAAAPVAPPPVEPASPQTTPAPAAPIPVPTFVASAPELSLEARIGTQWFGRIGVIAILCGVAWLLKWAMDYGWLGPAARVTLGLAAGLAFFGWAEYVWRKQVPLTAYALFAVGNGIIYLSIWAGLSVYHLIGRTEALVLLAAVTAWNGYRSWTNDSHQFAAYALLLGFLIPLLLANGENHEVELFVFLLLLDGAVTVLAVLKPWRFLLPTALAGTVVVSLVWSFSFLNHSDWLAAALFAVILDILFSLGCRGICLRRVAELDDSLQAIPVPMLVTFSGLVGLWTALRSSLIPGRAWIAALTFGLISLGLFAATPARSQGNLRTFRLTQFALALGLLTLAALMHFRGTTLILVLAVEGAVLTAVSARWRTLFASRAVAPIAMVLAVLGAMSYRYDGAQPFWNPVVGVSLATLAALAVSLGLLDRAGRESPDADPQLPLRLPVLRVAYAGAAVILLWVLGLRIIHIAWWGAANTSAFAQAAGLQLGSQFSYSAWCMGYGAALLAIGFWRRLSGLRWQGLVLLVLAIAKVFLYDMSTLTQGWRVLSLFGLGVLLLLVSFAYQRDWLALRVRQ